MKEKTFRIYGLLGHRQRASFHASKTCDFSKEGVTRRLSFRNADLTGTNLYTELTIECDGDAECYAELCGQLTDGFFANSGFGKVAEVINGEEVQIDPWARAGEARM